MDLWEVLKASKGVPITSDMYDALFGKALGGAGSVWETENAPYLFRQSGGVLNSRLLNKEKDTIVGASVAWNQLLASSTGQSRTGAYSGMFSESDVNLINGHKYFVSFMQPSGCAVYRQNRTDFTVGYHGYNAPNMNTTISFLGVATGTSTQSFGSLVSKAETTETAYRLTECMFTDLTQMFGSTIADYAYTLETQTAGSGVAWLKSYGFFGLPYYAYDSGSIKSVSGLVSHKMTGFNQWDEEWEVGIINNNGTVSSGDRVVSKNYVRVIEGLTYCMSWKDIIYVGRGAFYDTNENLVSYLSDFPAGAITTVGDRRYGVFTVPSGACYLKFCTNSSYGNTYNHDICINISNADLNGTYKPYHADTYPLDSTLTLRGLFKMDADHNLYAEGDTYESSGVVTRKYVEFTADGNSGQTVSVGTNPYTYIAITLPYPLVTGGSSQGNVRSVCDRLSIYKYDSNVGHANTYYINSGANSILYLRELSDFSGTTQAEARTYLSSHPVTVVYELATPTTDQAEPFASPQNVDKAGTEEYVTTDKFVPVGHSTEYKVTPTP